jgi:hypothetical protein
MKMMNLMNSQIKMRFILEEVLLKCINKFLQLSISLRILVNNNNNFNNKPKKDNFHLVHSETKILIDNYVLKIKIKIRA